MSDKFTILDFKKKKESGRKITMLTAYDYTMATLVDKTGIDAILVGDSLGMVVLGYDSTVSVTMAEMLHHTKAVARGVTRSFLIADMPFMSYQVSDEEAVRNAGRFIKEAGASAVKVEGGNEITPRIKAVTAAGIAVLGHIGLTPQSVSKLGGFKVQGKTKEDAKRLLDDAISLEKAGCFAIVLECVPRLVAEKITKRVKIPIIGIGAGSGCDGQVLVTNDLLGYYEKILPKFVKRYASINSTILEALEKFKTETESGVFPGEEHSF